jgi:hypothetical protein
MCARNLHNPTADSSVFARATDSRTDSEKTAPPGPQLPGGAVTRSPPALPRRTPPSPLAQPRSYRARCLLAAPKNRKVRPKKISERRARGGQAPRSPAVSEPADPTEVIPRPPPAPATAADHPLAQYVADWEQGCTAFAEWVRRRQAGRRAGGGATYKARRRLRFPPGPTSPRGWTVVVRAPTYRLPLRRFGKEGRNPDAGTTRGRRRTGWSSADRRRTVLH